MIVEEEEEEKNQVKMIKYVVYLHSVMIYLFTEITNAKTCKVQKREREREKKNAVSRKYIKVLKRVPNEFLLRIFLFQYRLLCL